MSFRVFQGNVLSLNGWRMCNEDECVWRVVPGSNDVRIEVRKGIPETILVRFLERFNQVIEPLRDNDTACWTLGNSVATSQHPAGVAVDCNWELHPFHAYGTYGDRLSALRHLLDVEFRGCVGWGGDWGGNPQDEMHFEIAFREGYLADPNNNDSFVLAVDQRLIDLAAEIQASQPQPPAIPPAAQVLSDATGLDLGRASEILPTVVSGLHAAECTNVNRIAMWLAQCGEESAGFSTTEEFASGAAYEGRCDDLGNCSPGDGVKYKGRTWIQITGKAHYQEFSQWAFGKGLISSATQFVDNPTSLGDLPWAGIGAAWYWTVSRPDINALSDAGDVVEVTHRINGGETGLAERQSRYALAHALGDQLLALTTGAPPAPPTQGEDMAAVSQEEWARVAAQMDRVFHEVSDLRESRSPLREPDEGPKDTWSGFGLNTDGSEHVEICKLLAGYGHPPTIAKLKRVAAMPVDKPGREGDCLIAQAILADVTSAPAPVAAAPMVAPVQPPQVVYVDRPAAAAPAALPAPVESSNGAAPTTTGQAIGALFDALESMRLADALPIEARAPLSALISVLQTKNGSQL